MSKVMSQSAFDNALQSVKVGLIHSLVLDARMNVEKLGGPWSCFGIFRVLSLRVLS